MIKKSEKAGLIIIIVVLGFVFHYKYLNEFPSHIHAWAQSDRYALALGFLDNGLNFFKPQTFIFNHQFPHHWELPSDKTITAVDFPIHDYIPALLMKLSGTISPWVFRSYILLYSFLGLFFLFKLAYSITNDYLKSVFVVVFAASSPIYVYYQGGFLPTIPSLSNTMIGIYFYYRHLKENKKIDFWLSVFWLTLAALARTTFAIPIVAVMVNEFFRWLKKETGFASKVIPVSISILALLSYFLYNGYLREKYGSIFLNYIMPPDDFQHLKEIFKSVYDLWIFQYFSIPHYLVLLVVFLLAVYFIAKRKSAFSKEKIYFGSLLLVYIFGCAVFTFLMLRQFPDHDYYFLDTFYLPIVAFFILFLSQIPMVKTRKSKIIAIPIVSLTSLLLMLQPIKYQETRRETGSQNKTIATIKNFKNASEFLDSLEISHNSKILVIDVVAPNIPFILMQRKGFGIMNVSRKNIEETLKWDFDFIVIQNGYLISEVYVEYPEILSKLNKIGDNGKISVFTLSTDDE